MDKNKSMLMVGLGLLGGKYAQVLSQKGYRVTGITHSQSTLDYALEHAYICEGRNENFDDLVQNADYIIFGLYPTVLLEWVKQYGHLVRPGTLITDVSGVKRGVVEPVQQMLPEGVEFIASHPMAGRETSGVAHSAEVNFAPANFIITPTEKNTPAAISPPPTSKIWRRSSPFRLRARSYQRLIIRLKIKKPVLNPYSSSITPREKFCRRKTKSSAIKPTTPSALPNAMVVLRCHSPRRREGLYSPYPSAMEI